MDDIEIKESLRDDAKREIERDISKIVDYNREQVKKDVVSIEGQLIASFAFGVLCGPFTYSILILLLFFVLYEIIFFIIYKKWPVKLRLSVIVAYIIGLLIGCYCAQAQYPMFFY